MKENNEEVKSEHTLENIRDENERLKETVSKQIQVIEELKKERDEFLERTIFHQDSFKNYEIMLKEMEEERTRLKKKVINLEMQLATDTKPSEGVKESVEEIIPSDDNHQHTAEKDPQKEFAKSSVSCDSGICVNLDMIKEEIGKTIDSIIATKFNERRDVNASALKSESPKRHEISHDRERNFIIHGMTEDNINTSDKDKVRDILDAINIESEPVTMFRLGIKEQNKKRPLLVRMHSKDEKKTILTNLSRLKYATRKYDERISITPDYTPEERKMIKELVKEARRRNTNDAKEEYLWKER